MPQPRPWTATETRRLKKLHADGWPLHRIAKELGRSKSTIGLHSARLGLTWDRTRTSAATKAKVIDAKARRAQLELDLLDDAARLRKQLWEPCVVFNFGGRDNTYEEHHADEPPAADKLKLVQAARTALDGALRIAVHDNDQGVNAQISLVGRLAGAIGVPLPSITGQLQ